MAPLCSDKSNTGAKAYWLGEEREGISSKGLPVSKIFDEMELQTLQRSVTELFQKVLASGCPIVETFSWSQPSPGPSSAMCMPLGRNLLSKHCKTISKKTLSKRVPSKDHV